MASSYANGEANVYFRIRKTRGNFMEPQIPFAEKHTYLHTACVQYLTKKFVLSGKDYDCTKFWNFPPPHRTLGGNSVCNRTWHGGQTGIIWFREIWEKLSSPHTPPSKFSPSLCRMIHAMMFVGRSEIGNFFLPGRGHPDYVTSLVCVCVSLLVKSDAGIGFSDRRLLEQTLGFLVATWNKLHHFIFEFTIPESLLVTLLS